MIASKYNANGANTLETYDGVPSVLTGASRSVWLASSDPCIGGSSIKYKRVYNGLAHA